MAKAAKYSLGPETFPRGWFIVAESKELDDGPLPVRFFGKDFALYRGESGAVVMLDAYCAHMGTHIAASKSAVIVQNGKQIEGDCIRCPYHGWRYAADARLDDIPYHQGPLAQVRCARLLEGSSSLQLSQVLRAASLGAHHTPRRSEAKPR